MRIEKYSSADVCNHCNDAPSYRVVKFWSKQFRWGSESIDTNLVVYRKVETIVTALLHEKLGMSNVEARSILSLLSLEQKPLGVKFLNIIWALWSLMLIFNSTCDMRGHSGTLKHNKGPCNGCVNVLHRRRKLERNL